MVLKEVNFEEELYSKKNVKEKKRRGETKKMIDDFIKSKIDCVEIIDEEFHYNNNNDVYRQVLSCLNRSKEINNVVVFMMNGRVFLKRK